MSEFEPDSGAGYYDDPNGVGQIDADQIDPLALSRMIEQSSQLGAQRALGEVSQVMQQNQQTQFAAQISQTTTEAERALAAYDPSWPTKQQLAYETLQEHPTFLPPEAAHDPNAMAEGLWDAYEWGAEKRRNHQEQLKEADDNAAFQAIKAAHQTSWSQRMSVHDVLDNS